MFSKKNGFDKEMQKAENETISSIIDKSMSVSGEISFKGKTRIDGTINGNITGEHLVLSESGKIIGDVKVSSFICHGYLEGNIMAKLVTASKGCSIIGKLEAGSLTVEPGATLDGEVKAAAGTNRPADPKGADSQTSVPKKNDT
ncbi:MAG: polymer-forming cytoskeletal protein [Desulfocapsaceae bacterium]|jgi:cytoskeletal protein CcmA (bactofilin family)|nr:polymer-forming cytoskeletal protein [Desulfocapsaceae bacterium]